MLDTLQALEATQVGTLVRESLYGFPILVALHLLGLTLSVGILMWFDLRLLGVALASARVTRVYRRLIPWATAGFVVMFVTGPLLFTGYAVSAWGNPYFRVKVAALVLAAANALVYHRSTERRIADWDTDAQPPRAARLAGAVSLLAWAIVILCGRMMAYTMY